MQKHSWSSLLLWAKLFSWGRGTAIVYWVYMHITHAHATLRYIASPAAQLVAVVNPAAPSKCKLMNTSHSLSQECAYPPVCCEEGPAGSTVVASQGPINVLQQMIHNVQCHMFLIKSHDIVTCSQSPKRILYAMHCWHRAEGSTLGPLHVGYSCTPMRV